MVCYSIKLISPACFITLPNVIEKCRSIKIKKLFCKILSTHITNVIIQINSYDNQYYFDGVNRIPYTFIFFNDQNSNMVINYINYSNTFDYYSHNERELKQFNINVLANSSLWTDISVSNPLFLELEFN